MKSREVPLSNDLSCAVSALLEVEQSALRAGLSREQTNVLRLLTEEMISMTTDLLANCRGSFWMAWEGLACQLHLTAAAPMEAETRAAFLAASKAKVNAPVKGLKNRISALLAGMFLPGDCPDLWEIMGPGFQAGSSAPQEGSSWSMAAYRRNQSHREAELEGVEQSILTGLADDVVVSVRSSWVELVVKKTFLPVTQAAMPVFTGLSHICIFVDDLQEGISYYRRLLGAQPDHYLSHWRNPGFFRAAGFLQEAEEGEVSIAFLNVPGAKLTLELMQYHHPQGRQKPVFFAANDVSGARHVALKTSNIQEAFLHVKAMPDTRLINPSEDYRVFQISPTQPDQVRFFDQDPRESDQRNENTARILSQVQYVYFLDKYGLQWEFEQGHTDIGS